MTSLAIFEELEYYILVVYAALMIMLLKVRDK